MVATRIFTALLLGVFCQQAAALSLAPEEFQASRQLACVLAEQSLGYLDERQYGEKAHTVLDGFDEAERDNILAKALGYHDGLMFSIEPDDAEQVSERLETFVASASCRQDDGFVNVKATLSL
ncbi:MAG: hypothetical protein V2I26_12660 [Halieaceae bacterium]|jgi:hypothetical protein|nr:hypothetical protein [Halieaceae bacterium]